MSVGEILGWVNQMLVDWGVMPFISAMFVILLVIATIVFLRRLGTGS